MALRLLTFAAITVSGAARAEAASKPHLVFFLADDYGFADCSYHTEMYGNSSNVIQTPNLDSLSAAGIRLEQYVGTSSF